MMRRFKPGDATRKVVRLSAGPVSIPLPAGAPPVSAGTSGSHRGRLGGTSNLTDFMESFLQGVNFD
jgi:hypothetical protein